MILIISDISDIQVYWVGHFLNRFGVDYKLFCPSEYPIKIIGHTTYSGRVVDDRWAIGTAETLIPETIKSVWYRKPGLPKLPDGLKEYEREYSLNECRQALYGLYNGLAHAFWISPIHNLRIASNKPLQLRHAISLGFTIPETLITNDPAMARDFYKRFSGNVIYKTLSDGILYTREGPWEEPIIHGEIYTSLLKDVDSALFEMVRNTPCLFQEYIQKTYELRVIVVHDKVFAVEIHSQQTIESSIDYRRGNVRDMPHRHHDLPNDVAEKCVSLVRALGLEFGALDLVHRPDGEYVFLEVNPNGQFGWLEDTIGPQISEYIAKMLIEPPIQDGT